MLDETSLNIKFQTDAKAAIASFRAILTHQEYLKCFYSAARNCTFQQLKFRLLLQVFLISSLEWMKIHLGILCPKTHSIQKYMYTLLNCSSSE